MLEPHEQIRHWWDADADVYDEAAGHAMSDPVEAAAWRRALERTLPPPPGAVLDVGTGTASLALRAAELGFDVTGVDLSEGMLRVGREKAVTAGVAVDLVHGAAEGPPPGPFDAVMERHVLWTIPRPVEALAAWRAVTRPGGRLVCFEGSGRRGAVRRAGRPRHHRRAAPTRARRPPRVLPGRIAAAPAGHAFTGALPGSDRGGRMDRYPARPSPRRRVGDRTS